MVEHGIPAMIHVSTSCNACFHTTGAHYINADTTAVMQLIQGDLFKDFPELKFVIPHGGGAAPYHWGRYRGLAQELKKPLLRDHLLNNVFFDTCVYHQPGIDLLTRVIPVDNILFASEMIGAVKGIDPETGFNFDDTKRYIEATLNLRRRIATRSTRAMRAASIRNRPSMRPSKPRGNSDMYELGVVYRNIQRTDAATADALAALGSATVHEAMGRVGLMKPYMRPIHRRRAGVGHGGHRAAASRRQLDDARRRRADPARRHRRRRDQRRMQRRLLRRPAGDQLQARGARALVIDAGVRDVKTLTEMQFPVWSKASAARAPSRPRWAR
jgi:hypothetical protein